MHYGGPVILVDSGNNMNMKRLRESLLPAVSPFDNNSSSSTSNEHVHHQEENIVPQLFSPIPYKSSVSNNHLNENMDLDSMNLIKRFRRNDAAVSNDNISTNNNMIDNNNNPSSFFGLHDRAKKRKDNCDNNISSSSSSSSENVGFLTAINKELQVQLSHKSDEVNSNKQVIQQLGMFVFNSQEKVKQMEEENKILKKAVAIQDSRIKELNEASHQYQTMLQQAAVYVQTLERQNNQLRAVLNINDGSGSYNDFHPLPPPDGY